VSITVQYGQHRAGAIYLLNRHGTDSHPSSTLCQLSLNSAHPLSLILVGDMNITLQHRASFIVRGLGYGIAAGFVASEVFIAASCILALIDSAFQGSPITTGLSGAFVVAIYGQLFGMLPAIFVGSVCGAIIGLAFAVITHPLRRSTAITIGVGIAVVLLCIAFFSITRNTPASQNQSSALLQPPGLLLLIAPFILASGAWVGHKLAQRQQGL